MHKTNSSRRPRPSGFRAHLRKRFTGSPALVEEYIRESEHQDGNAYWQNFQTLKDADEDFERYRENVDSSAEKTLDLSEKVSNLIAESSNLEFFAAVAKYYEDYAQDPIMPPPRAVRASAQSIVLALRSRALSADLEVLDKDMDNMDDTEVDVLAWNTGRQYTKEGQRIAAVRVPGGIVFVDIDRHIDGFIASAEAPFTATHILQAYDNNWYTGQSYQFDEERRMLEERARQVPALAGGGT